MASTAGSDKVIGYAVIGYSGRPSEESFSCKAGVDSLSGLGREGGYSDL